MRVYKDSLDAIGQTPMQILSKLSPNQGGTVWAKLEYMMPGSSVKDRIALYMVREAVEKGWLQEGGAIIEATAGNTGVGLAVVASALGYRFLCIMPQKFSMEKQKLVEFLGGEVIRTPTEDGMKGAIAKAHELRDEMGNAWVAGQFENQTNPQCHYETTGPEIWEQTDGKITHFATGAGTGGTFTGVSRFLKEKNPDIKCYVVEPNGSILGGGEPGDHWVEGIGNTFFPETLDMSLSDGVITVDDRYSKETVKALAKSEQILAGGSSAANVYAAIQVAKDAKPGDVVVTLVCDRMERYISKGILDL